MRASPVAVFEWPVHEPKLAELQHSGVARLVLVDDGTEPPVSDDCCQDWMWRSGGEREMRLRLQQLALRSCEHGHSRPVIDSIGMLRVGVRSVHLPDKERLLVAALLEDFGANVPRDDLIRAAWPDGVSSINILTSRISALRSRLRWLGLQVVHTSSGGYSLQAAPVTGGGAGGTGGSEGFEDEIPEAALVRGSQDRYSPYR